MNEHESGMKAFIKAIKAIGAGGVGGPRLQRTSRCQWGECQKSADAGIYCKACEVLAIRQTRAGLLGDAYGSLPKKYEWAKFGENPKEWAAYVSDRTGQPKAKRSLDKPRVTLAGKAGSGKTSLAIAMAHAILEPALLKSCEVEPWRRAEGLRFVSAHDLASAAAESGLGEKSPLVVAALAATVLIIDDLGASQKVHNDQVPRVIYDRDKDGLQTIVTVGLTTDEIKAIYGTGIVRRVFEGDVALIGLTGGH